MTPSLRVIAAMAVAIATTINVAAARDCPAPAASESPTAASIERLLAHADCLTGAGRGIQALGSLGLALQQVAAEGVGSAGEIAIRSRLGRVYASLGDFEAATLNLNASLALAESSGNESVLASLLNDLGGVHMAMQRPLEGLAAYSDGARLAQGALAVTVGTNLARALWETGMSADLPDRLAALAREAGRLPESTVKASAQLAIGELYRELALSDLQSLVSAELRRDALASYEVGLSVARDLGDDRLESFAFGYLGQLYADAGRVDDALALSRRAALLAQSASAHDSLYRWEWQTGRLLAEKREHAQAIVAYRDAVDTLQQMGPTTVASQRVFERDVAPLYAEYADLLLASTAAMSEADSAATLAEVQRALEQFRLAEVQNYFENQCVITQSPDPAGAAGEALVIYPILLDDRTEILVSGDGLLEQFTVGVGLERMTREIRELRSAIESEAADRDFLEPARQLYDWVIAPLEDTLARSGSGTLVFVPDGPLRTIPLAVLHDGERFLIERFALATTPGLSLLSLDDSAVGDRRVLASGIARSVQGFPPLPYVEDELRSIESVFPSRTLEDEAFVTDALEGEVLAGSYSIVHLATHAQFEANYRSSFLLAYDDVITMDELEDVMGIQRFTDQPVDLLVLSACQTAAGDDRAALGLAGVAVKAGARSALASLWLINDESTSVLMQEFYRRLALQDETKAAALRGAQLLLLNDGSYRHPSHWAPFLMIGDWR